MTKGELEQLRDLRKEIRELDDKIEHMQKQRAKETTDKVHASMKEYPYVYTTKTITGVDIKDKKRRKELTEIEILLLRRRQQSPPERRNCVYGRWLC